jgi:hypothetical protein
LIHFCVPGVLYSKSTIRGWKLANCRVDITFFILYLDLYWIKPVGLAAASVTAPYVGIHPSPSNNPINLHFLLDPLSKSEFLSFTSAAEEDCHTRGLVRGIIVCAIFFALNKLGKVKADG